MEFCEINFTMVNLSDTYILKTHKTLLINTLQQNHCG